MKLINREIINKNIKISSLQNNDGIVSMQTVDYDFVIDSINKAKTYLIKEKHAEPGQKILLATNGWPQYLIWFIAVSELGMSFAVSDYPNILNSESVAEKLKLFGKIDHLIGNLNSEVIKWYPSIIDRLIDRNVYYDYDDDSCGSTFLCQENDVLLWMTSSGTTNTPKVIAHTHEFYYSLLERNAKLYNLQDTDRCLHTKGLHHGSVTGVYFLPSIKYCAAHFYASADQDDWVDLIQTQKINRCLMFYTMFDNFCKNISVDKKIHDNLMIYVLAKITNDNIEIAVKKLGYKIASIFGCTETSGPLLLPEINLDNVDHYDPNNFGPVIDDFYHMDIDNNEKLIVKMPDGKFVETGDKFLKVDGNFIFLGRENLYRINGKAFYLNAIIESCEEILNQQHGNGFDLVVDQQTNSVYIRSDLDLNLDSLNTALEEKIPDPSYRISKKVIGQRNKFFTGIKFDPEEIRILCRKD